MLSSALLKMYKVPLTTENLRVEFLLILGGGGGRGSKNFRKVFAGGVRNFYFGRGGGGGNFVGGSHNFEVKLKIG